MAAVEPAILSTPKPTLVWMVGVALVVATLIVVCFVLPAEFRIDPLGVGKATGMIRLAGPKKMSATEAALAAAGITGAADSSESVGETSAAAAGASASPGAGAAHNAPGVSARYYDGGYRSDFVDIPLTVAGSAERGEELEYKVHMKKGDTLAYSWSVTGIANPEEFYYDFHGEAPAKEQGAEATVVEYRQATGTQSHGTLVAPFDGVFGWYLQNQSEKPVVVHLKISGFYALVPPGEYGNEAGIEANQPAKP
jgi:hypothetical protein